MVAGCTLTNSLAGFSGPAPSEGGLADDAAVQDSGLGDGPTAGIQWRDTKSTPLQADGPEVFKSGAPKVVAGDFMVASLAVGNTNNTVLAELTAPAGWSLVRRLDIETVSSLAIYVHVATADEPSEYSWSSRPPTYGAVWISAYSGVDTGAPIDVEDGVAISKADVLYATPPVVTTVPGTFLLASYATKAWSTTTLLNAPTGTVTRATLNNGSMRAALGVEASQALAGPIGRLAAQAVAEQAYGLTHVLALRPARR